MRNRVKTQVEEVTIAIDESEAFSRLASPAERMLLDKVVNEAQERRSAERAGETDTLTGVANQKALIKALPAAEADPNTVVMSTDVGNLKAVNTLLGREGGDTAIKDAATAVRQAAEENGESRVFRDSGDEILALVPKEKAEAIRKRAAELFRARKAGDYDVTLDVGVGENREAADAKLKSIKGEREKSFRKIESVEITFVFSEDGKRVTGKMVNGMLETAEA